MEKRIVSLFVLTVISMVALVFLFSSVFSFTGNIIKESGFSVGENLTGDLIIVLKGGDELISSSPLLISLVKDDEVIKIETFTFEKFILSSGFEARDVYSGPDSFSADLEDFFQHQFNEAGNYELLFSVIELDFNHKETFFVY